MAQLNFHKVNSDYCDFLRQQDPCVPYTFDAKQNRPFVGVVFDFGGLKYYAPLSSPKPKHLAMKNQIDFLKIDGGKLGAINFNNMIPVPAACLEKVDLALNPTDSKPTKDYKNLMIDQVNWCVHNEGRILEMAQKLHQIITQGRAYPSLEQRCCKFALNEQRHHDYCVEQGLAPEKMAQAHQDKRNALSTPQEKVSVMERLEQAKQTLDNRATQSRGSSKTPER